MKNSKELLTTEPGTWLILDYPWQDDCWDGRYDYRVRTADGKTITGDVFYRDGSREFVVIELRAGQWLDITRSKPFVIASIKAAKKAPKLPKHPPSLAEISMNNLSKIHAGHAADNWN